MLRLLWTLVSSLVISAMLFGPIMTVNAQQVEEFVPIKGVVLVKDNVEVESRTDPVVIEEIEPIAVPIEDTIITAELEIETGSEDPVEVEEPAPATEVVEDPVTAAEVEIGIESQPDNPVEVEEPVPATVETFDDPVVVAVETGSSVIIEPDDAVSEAEVGSPAAGAFFGFDPAACQGGDAVVCVSASAAGSLKTWSTRRTRT